MTGLQNTYGYDKSEMIKANEMLKMGQVPMDINAMQGLVEDVSDAEGRKNALQSGDTCYLCKKPGHQKRDCRKFDEWKRKNPNRKYGSDPRNFVLQLRKECHISWECRGEQGNQGRRGNGGSDSFSSQNSQPE